MGPSGLPGGWACKEAAVVFLEIQGEAWLSRTRWRWESPLGEGLDLGLWNHISKADRGVEGGGLLGKEEGLPVFGQRKGAGPHSHAAPRIHLAR